MVSNRIQKLPERENQDAGIKHHREVQTEGDGSFQPRKKLYEKELVKHAVLWLPLEQLRLVATVLSLECPNLCHCDLPELPELLPLQITGAALSPTAATHWSRGHAEVKVWRAQWRTEQSTDLH